MDANAAITIPPPDEIRRQIQLRQQELAELRRILRLALSSNRVIVIRQQQRELSSGGALSHA